MCTAPHYPLIEINLTYLRRNLTEFVLRCHAEGINVAGVIKGLNGIPEMTKQFELAGCDQIASSRLEQLEDAKAYGVKGPFLLLRVPMLTELPRMLNIADYSLQSELAVIDATEEECRRQNKTHKVIVMADLGDLREGFWDKDEMTAVCTHIERDLPHVELAGIGTNLGCYGSIRPTVEKFNELICIAQRIEAAIGRKLEIVSGGATSAYPFVDEKKIPHGINHLRLGGGVIITESMFSNWGLKDRSYLRTDVFTLKAEVVEVKEKPLPLEALQNKQTQNQQKENTVRRLARLAIGWADVSNVNRLLPRAEGVTVTGGSDEYTVLDITDHPAQITPGDIMEFDLNYTTMVFLTRTGKANIKFIE